MIFPRHFEKDITSMFFGDLRGNSSWSVGEDIIYISMYMEREEGDLKRYFNIAKRDAQESYASGFVIDGKIWWSYGEYSSCCGEITEFNIAKVFPTAIVSIYENTLGDLGGISNVGGRLAVLLLYVIEEIA